MASVRPVWVDDGETPQCTKCQVEFGFFNRRHHCRGCGKIFCKLCCNKWIHMPPEYEYDDPQRLCISCFERFSSLDFTTFQDQYGEPGQPTVVLLHGALQTRKSLTFLAKHLEHCGYYVLVPDIPGHGTRFRETLTDGSVLDVVKDLIEKKATNKKALVFGYHLGAYIAITFAATYPDLCVGVVAGGAGTDMSQASLGLAVIGLLYKIVSNKTLATLIQENAESFPMSTNILPETMMECVLRPGTYYEPWDNIRIFLCGQDYNKFLQQYPGHVMFLNGSYDVRDAEEKWMKAATHSELRIIEGAGHFMYLDEEFYQTFNRCVTDFADSINWDDPTGPRLDIDTTPIRTEEDDPKNNVELSFVGKPIARNHSLSSDFPFSSSSPSSASSSSFISASPSDASSPPFLSSSPASSSSSSSSSAAFETIS